MLYLLISLHQKPGQEAVVAQAASLIIVTTNCLSKQSLFPLVSCWCPIRVGVFVTVVAHC